MKIFDTFTFFNELDLLELRFEILDPYVDHFILVESHETFSGQPKPLYYEENKERFKKWNKKVIHIVVPNMEVTDGNLFRRHYLCYETIENYLLKNADPEDVAFCSDLDEIWNPNIIKCKNCGGTGAVFDQELVNPIPGLHGDFKNCPVCDGKRTHIDDLPHSLYQYNYSYWLNYRSNERWTGSLMTKVKNLFVGFNKKNRTAKPNLLEDGGWHFSNQGGAEQIIKKLNAYDHSNEVVPFLSQFYGYGIQDRMDKGLDFLGRQFNYDGVPFEFHVEQDENLPEYLVNNKDKWSHMLK